MPEASGPQERSPTARAKPWIDAEHRFGLRVGAVQLDVAHRSVDGGLALFDARRQLSLTAADWKLRDGAFDAAEHPRQALQLTLHLPPPRERPLGDIDRLAPV